MGSPVVEHGLVVVGTLLVDEVLTLSAPALPGTQQRARARRLTGGGQVWHTTRAAAAAGAVVVAAGRRGADADGDRLARDLAADGVIDRLLAAGTSRRAIVLAAPPAERAIVSVAGTEPDLPLVGTAPPAGAAPLAGADPIPGAVTLGAAAGWLHLDGFGLDDACGPLALAAAAAAAAAGRPICVEPPSIAGLPARRDRLRLLPALDLLVGRPDEVAAARAELSAEPRVVVTHDGPNPVTWTQRGVKIVCPVPDVADLDTLGAGDRFTGGLLAALLAGAEPGQALAAGVEAAVRIRLAPTS